MKTTAQVMTSIADRGALPDALALATHYGTTACGWPVPAAVTAELDPGKAGIDEDRKVSVLLAIRVRMTCPGCGSTFVTGNPPVIETGGA